MNTDFLVLAMFNLFCHIFSMLHTFYAYPDSCGITDLLSEKTQAKGIFLNLCSSASYIFMLTVLICHSEKERGKQLLQTHKICKPGNKGYFHDNTINF